mmetsp:Transcript_24625/g.78756  ORF Transcript_24625/g.78756 Transcript_24625/m.78756 type:complete len:248 (-) Transcript_24625:59-802(-)
MRKRTCGRIKLRERRSRQRLCPCIRRAAAATLEVGGKALQLRRLSAPALAPADRFGPVAAVDQQDVGRRELAAEQVLATGAAQLVGEHVHHLVGVLASNLGRLRVRRADEFCHVARVLAVDPERLAVQLAVDGCYQLLVAAARCRGGRRHQLQRGGSVLVAEIGVYRDALVYRKLAVYQRRYLAKGIARVSLCRARAHRLVHIRHAELLEHPQVAKRAEAGAADEPERHVISSLRSERRACRSRTLM